MEETKSSNFPARPPLSSKPSGKIITLATNSYTMRIKTSNYIFVYAVKFSEEIPSDNTPLRRLVIRGLKSELDKSFKCHIFTGSVLYSPVDIGTAPLILSYSSSAINTRVDFVRAHMICVQDIISSDKDPAKAQTALTFLNIVVKNLLTACNMYPIGRTKKYLLPGESKSIPEYPIEIWPGYYTSVNFCEAGLLLEVDYSSRILRQESVYEFIRGKQKMMESGWQEAVKEEIVGKSVLARYGNKMTYVVSDIDFTTSPAKFMFETTSGTVSIMEYFKKKYLTTIKDTDQPLLISIKKQKDGKENRIHLVPELCSLTGLPDNLREDRSALQRFSVYTKLSPDNRMKESERLLTRFAKAKNAAFGIQENNDDTLMGEWNLSVDIAPNQVKGRVLPNQEIMLNGSKSLKVPDNGQFFFKEPVTIPMNFDKWILVHGSKDQQLAEHFVDNLYDVGKTFGIAIEFPTYAETRGIKARDYIDALEKTMEKVKEPKIVVFILPPPAINEYAKLKQYALTHSPPIFTQMVKTRTLNSPKGIFSICGKIALQMNAKRNGVLWRIKAPSSVPKKTMVIGIDSSKEGKMECLGFSASYDPYFSRYYTQVINVKEKQGLNSGIGGCTVKALERFYLETGSKFLPDLLVIYRDGLCETQRNNVLNAELEAILTAINKRYGDKYKPKLIYSIIHKKIHTRFFMKSSECTIPARRGASENSILSNPQPGTIVHTGIVDPRKYEFLMMPQHVNEGTGTPSRITVLHDSSGLPMETFEELTNTLCYAYYNWQGAIRTPAPCKYAFCHAKLISKYAQVSPNEALLSFLYFL